MTTRSERTTLEISFRPNSQGPCRAGRGELSATLILDNLNN
jgi:hypothetical protein